MTRKEIKRKVEKLRSKISDAEADLTELREKLREYEERLALLEEKKRTKKQSGNGTTTV